MKGATIMEVKGKDVLLFCSGLACGIVGGIFATKSYFEKKFSHMAEDRIQEIEAYYEVSDKYRRTPDDVDIKDQESIYPNSMKEEKLDEIKERLLKNHQKTTDYASMYKGEPLTEEEEIKMAEAEHPEDDEEESGFSDGEIGTENEEFVKWHKENRHKPPRIISVEDAEELPEFIENIGLYYYAEDQVLTDEDDHVEENYRLLIGDALTKFGFDQNDEELIYVINYELDTCYEIHKLFESYKESFGE